MILAQTNPASPEIEATVPAQPIEVEAVPPTPPPSPPSSFDDPLAGLELADEDRRNLEASGLSEQTIQASGIVTAASVMQLTRLGFDGRHAPAMVIPYPGTGTPYRRIRPSSPSPFEPEAPKYLALAGSGNRLYHTPGTFAHADDPAVPLLIVEGEKKALAAWQLDYKAVGVSGVWNWRCKKTGVIEDVGRIKWRGRQVTVCFDSDLRVNANVREALAALVVELEGRGAKVRVALLPMGEDGSKQGFDDCLVKHGPDACQRVVNHALPLVDAAVALIESGLAPVELDERVSFACRAASAYPSMDNHYAGTIATAMRATGYTPPQMRSLLKRIHDEQKKAATKPKEDLAPLKLAKEFLAEEMTDDDQRSLLHHVHSQFYEYDGRVYAEKSPEEIKTQITRYIQLKTDEVSRTLVADTMLNVEALCGLPRETAIPCDLRIPDKPADHLLAFQNVLVHTGGGFWQGGYVGSIQHSPEYLVTRMFPFRYDAEADCPLWDRFLREVSYGDESWAALLEEWFGYHLDPSLHLEKFAIFLGDGANGKSVVLRVLEAMLGTDACTAIPLNRIGDRFQAGRLHGAMANIVGDLEAIDKTDEGLIKQLVSGDRVTGEFKNRNPFTFTPRARHTFACNTLPRFRDTSDGLWRRILLVPFNYTVPEDRRDTKLADKIIARELPGVFNWALAGAVRLHRNGRFSQCQVVEDMLASYKNSCNTVAAFVREVCVIEPIRTVSKQMLYDRYCEWCRRNGHPYPLSQARFGRELYRVVPGLGNERPRVDGNIRQNVYVGVGIDELTLRGVA